jgi:hypothetical protein
MNVLMVIVRQKAAARLKRAAALKKLLAYCLYILEKSMPSL